MRQCDGIEILHTNLFSKRSRSVVVRVNLKTSVTVAANSSETPQPSHVVSRVSSSKGFIVQQVKIFKAVDTELEDLEKQINRFIRKNNVRVLSISGNHSASVDSGGGPLNTFSGGDVTVIMLFEIETPGR